MQFSPPLGNQQFQARQLPTGSMQHGIGQSQLNQGNQLNRHLNQFSSSANTALFNAAQGTPNTQMVSYMHDSFYCFHFLSLNSCVSIKFLFPIVYMLSNFHTTG